MLETWESGVVKERYQAFGPIVAGDPVEFVEGVSVKTVKQGSYIGGTNMAGVALESPVDGWVTVQVYAGDTR